MCLSLGLKENYAKCVLNIDFQAIHTEQLTRNISMWIEAEENAGIEKSDGIMKSNWIVSQKELNEP